MTSERELKENVQKATRTSGEEHLDTGLALMELGDFYELESRYPEAEQEYKRAAKVYESLGADHELFLAIAIKSAAEVARMQHKDEEAASLKKRSRDLMRAASYRNPELNGNRLH